MESTFVERTIDGVKHKFGTTWEWDNIHTFVLTLKDSEMRVRAHACILFLDSDLQLLMPDGNWIYWKNVVKIACTGAAPTKKI